MTKALSPVCRSEVRRVMHARAASVSLDPRVFERCLSDLANVCEVEEEEGGADEEEEDAFEEVGEVASAKHKVKKPTAERVKGSSGLACLQDNYKVLSVCQVAAYCACVCNVI